MSESATPESAEKKDERTWGMLCHLTALVGFLIPFANIIGPLVVWLMKKEEFPLVDREGKKALNFQISVLIYGIVAAMLIFVFIGFLLLPAVGLFALICTIVAAVKTSNGEEFKYPLAITFLR